MNEEIHIALESFLDDHKEYTEEHKDNPPSPHKPKYPGLNTTAQEEFNALCLLNELSNRDLIFAYMLLTEKAIQLVGDYTGEIFDYTEV